MGGARAATPQHHRRLSNVPSAAAVMKLVAIAGLYSAATASAASSSRRARTPLPGTLGFAHSLRPPLIRVSPRGAETSRVSRRTSSSLGSSRRVATPTASIGVGRGVRWAAGALLRRRSVSGGGGAGFGAGEALMEDGQGRASPAIASTAAAADASEVGSAQFSWRRGEWSSSRGTGRNDDLASATSAVVAAQTAGEVGEDVVVAVGVEEEEEVLERHTGFRVGADLMADFKRRSKVYKADWTDGVNVKSFPAILFLYFACLLPAVAFGGIATQVTQGTLGVIEYVISCGVGGMVYAAFGGQPMTFIGPTGLTLAFMTALYSFTSVAGLPFLPVYAWVGMWTSSMLITLSLVGASNLIEYATQFTDDVFNALLSVNFIYEACRSLLRNFSPAIAGTSQASALMSLNVAVATYVGCRKTSGARDARIFNTGFREFMSDFGPLVVIIGMSSLCALPSWKGLLSFLEVPSAFMLCKGRSWLVPMLSVGPKVRMACALPAMLLTSLFFLDQNISSRVVNSPRHKMLKGPAYHQDMLVLGLITAVLSVIGLPWQCAATVQSLNHVRQMATFESSPVSTGAEEIASVRETRVTGFCVHALVLGSLALLPQLGRIPMPVVSGIFLYLGRKVMSGNGFLIRVKETIADRSLLPSDSDMKKVGFGTASKYTLVQASMLALLWTLKSFERTALFFPSVIGLLILVRLFVLPRMFTSKDLSLLDAAVG